jgi:hypothetical protein
LPYPLTWNEKGTCPLMSMLYNKIKIDINNDELLKTIWEYMLGIKKLGERGR